MARTKPSERASNRTSKDMKRGEMPFAPGSLGPKGLGLADDLTRMSKAQKLEAAVARARAKLKEGIPKGKSPAKVTK